MKRKHLYVVILFIFMLCGFLYLKHLTKEKYYIDKLNIIYEIFSNMDREDLFYAVSLSAKKVEDEELFRLLLPASGRMPERIYTKGSQVIYIYSSGEPKIQIEKLEFHSK